MEAFWDLFFPPRCPGCAESAGPHWCVRCEAQLSPARQHLAPGVEAWTCGVYSGSLQRAILRFKGDHRSSLQRGLSEVLARLDLPADLEAVVPVPSPARRLRYRGHNPVALLARPLSLCLGVPLRQVLACTGGAAAKSLSGDERRQAAARFYATGAVNGHVLLVDDVVTTGSTATECASRLLEAGARRVSVAALARAEVRLSSAVDSFRIADARGTPSIQPVDRPAPQTPQVESTSRA